MNLYPYQSKLSADIDDAWSRVQNVLAISSTGSGKTVVFSHKIAQHNGASCAIAHRQELVNQISVALARNGVRHQVLAGKDTIRDCVALQMRYLNRNFVDANARCAVAGVDTLIRMDANDPWFRSVGLWVMDEAHHTLRKNKWGKAVSMFPNAKGLGVTATGFRADGHGLGRHADGVFDEMIRAPGMRDIIDMGFLTEYRIFAPESDISLIDVPLSASGDWSPNPLRKAVHKCTKLTGDIADSYLKYTPGAIGVTFCVDVESATEQAAAFRHKGVPAEVVSANTPSMVRSAILDRLGRGEIKQVTNVDLFGEGFDLPAIEVVSMGRPTHSQGLYDQQFGRAIRKKDGKPWGTIIDHVGNVLRHGVPDGVRVHTLDRREKRSSSSVTAQLMRVCPECTGAYERVFGMKCPYCGHVALPAARTGPEFVDGDLFELSPEALARLRGEIDKQPVYPLNAGPEIVGAINKRHRERNDAIEYLREAMMYWAVGKNDIPRAQREFYLTFGTDVMTAQTLNRADALKLMERIYATI